MTDQAQRQGAFEKGQGDKPTTSTTKATLLTELQSCRRASKDPPSETAATQRSLSCILVRSLQVADRAHDHLLDYALSSRNLIQAWRNTQPSPGVLGCLPESHPLLAAARPISILLSIPCTILDVHGTTSTHSDDFKRRSCGRRASKH